MPICITNQSGVTQRCGLPQSLLNKRLNIALGPPSRRLLFISTLYSPAFFLHHPLALPGSRSSWYRRYFCTSTHSWYPIPLLIHPQQYRRNRLHRRLSSAHPSNRAPRVQHHSPTPQDPRDLQAHVPQHYNHPRRLLQHRPHIQGRRRGRHCRAQRRFRPRTQSQRRYRGFAQQTHARVSTPSVWNRNRLRLAQPRVSRSFEPEDMERHDLSY